jgi:hypothetical protein
VSEAVLAAIPLCYQHYLLEKNNNNSPMLGMPILTILYRIVIQYAAQSLSSTTQAISRCCLMPTVGLIVVVRVFYVQKELLRCNLH